MSAHKERGDALAALADEVLLTEEPLNVDAWRSLLDERQSVACIGALATLARVLASAHAPTVMRRLAARPLPTRAAAADDDGDEPSSSSSLSSSSSSASSSSKKKKDRTEEGSLGDVLTAALLHGFTLMSPAARRDAAAALEALVTHAPACAPGVGRHLVLTVDDTKAPKTRALLLQSLLAVSRRRPCAATASALVARANDWLGARDVETREVRGRLVE